MTFAHDRVATFEAVLKDSHDGFDRLLDGAGTEAERRDDLLRLMSSSWEAGYREGLQRGAELLAARLGEVPTIFEGTVG